MEGQEHEAEHGPRGPGLDVPAPRREDSTHRCCCVIIDEENGDRMRCGADGLPSDVPFCRMCEGRHADMAFICNVLITQEF